MGSHCNQNWIRVHCYGQKVLWYLLLDVLSPFFLFNYTKCCSLFSFSLTYQAHFQPKAFNIAHLLTVSLYGSLLTHPGLVQFLFPVLPGQTHALKVMDCCELMTMVSAPWTAHWAQLVLVKYWVQWLVGWMIKVDFSMKDSFQSQTTTPGLPSTKYASYITSLNFSVLILNQEREQCLPY